MNQRLRKNRAGLVLALVILAACSRDPSKQKADFLASREKYEKAGKYQEAVIQFRNAIEIDPRSAAALGMAYIAAGRPGNAARSLQQALSTNPDFSYATSAKRLFTKSRRVPSA